MADLSGGGGGGGARKVPDAVAVGSIAARRAARCGFVDPAPRLSTTARFRSVSPLSSPAALVTIPPGISPTALLDSPVLLLKSHQVWRSFLPLPVDFVIAFVNIMLSRKVPSS